MLERIEHQHRWCACQAGDDRRQSVAHWQAQGAREGGEETVLGAFHGAAVDAHRAPSGIVCIARERLEEGGLADAARARHEHDGWSVVVEDVGQLRALACSSHERRLPPPVEHLTDRPHRSHPQIGARSYGRSTEVRRAVGTADGPRCDRPPPSTGSPLVSRADGAGSRPG